MTRHFCIALRSKPDRIEHAKAQFEREGVPVEWFWAAEGKAHGIGAVYPMHYEQGADKPYFITNGMLSLVAANYYLALFAKLQNLDDYIVYEDDVILPEGYMTTLEQIRSERPADTKAIWLEHCCTDGKCQSRAKGMLHRIDPCPLCTACVWYFDKAYDTIIEKIGQFDTPWDILVERRLAADWKPCFTVPKLVKQATFEGQMSTTVAFDGHVPYRGEHD